MRASCKRGIEAVTYPRAHVLDVVLHKPALAPAAERERRGERRAARVAEAKRAAGGQRREDAVARVSPSDGPSPRPWRARVRVQVRVRILPGGRRRCRDGCRRRRRCRQRCRRGRAAGGPVRRGGHALGGGVVEGLYVLRLVDEASWRRGVSSRKTRQEGGGGGARHTSMQPGQVDPCLGRGARRAARRLVSRQRGRGRGGGRRGTYRGGWCLKRTLSPRSQRSPVRTQRTQAAPAGPSASRLHLRWRRLQPCRRGQPPSGKGRGLVVSSGEMGDTLPRRRDAQTAVVAASSPGETRKTCRRRLPRRDGQNTALLPRPPLSPSSRAPSPARPRAGATNPPNRAMTSNSPNREMPSPWPPLTTDSAAPPRRCRAQQRLARLARRAPPIGGSCRVLKRHGRPPCARAGLGSSWARSPPRPHVRPMTRCCLPRADPAARRGPPGKAGAPDSRRRARVQAAAAARGGKRGQKGAQGGPHPLLNHQNPPGGPATALARRGGAASCFELPPTTSASPAATRPDACPARRPGPPA